MCMLQSLCRPNNSRCLAMFVTIKVVFKYAGHIDQGKIKVIVSGQGNVINSYPYLSVIFNLS